MALTKDQLRIYQAFMAMPYGASIHFIDITDGNDADNDADKFTIIAYNLEKLVEALTFVAANAHDNEEQLREINQELQCVGSLLARARNLSN